MIDPENEVFTRVSEMLKTEFTGVNVASEYVKSPSAFPHVSVTMSDDFSLPEHEDSSLQENMVGVMFEVNVYSNRGSGKKAECKRIAKAISDLFYSMNFRRLAFTPVPNMEDATIHRITARYRAATDGNYFYRR